VAQGNRVAKEVSYLSTGTRAKMDIQLEPACRRSPGTWKSTAKRLVCTRRWPRWPAPGAGSFTEVELPAGEAISVRKCRRCLRCDLEWGQMKQREREAEALTV